MSVGKMMLASIVLHAGHFISCKDVVFLGKSRKGVRARGMNLRSSQVRKLHDMAYDTLQLCSPTLGHPHFRPHTLGPITMSTHRLSLCSVVFSFQSCSPARH